MIAAFIDNLHDYWLKTKEYLPLLGPAIALGIFAYNQVTRKRKGLYIEEFKGNSIL